MTTHLSEHVTVQHTKMAKVLANIVRDKHEWLIERKKAQPLETFQSQLVQSDRDFYAALKKPGTAFILECKKASPSKGLIRQRFDLDEICGVYKQYASAISVLTDEKYFQGNLEFLPVVRRQTTQPILCKDFMVSEYQVYLARHYGADAILLMLSVLSDEEYSALASVAHSLGMGVLTEASNEEEVERAIALKAQVVGINNRNLRDLTTDLNRTKQLAPQLPSDVTIISESGIYTNQQVRELSQFAKGFLIGSSLMAEENLELAARKVILGQHKVCGLTRAEDAAKVFQSGAVSGGLIFVEKSPRFVTLEQAKAVKKGAPLNYTGVFQNHSIEEVCHTAVTLSLQAVQLHGHEDQDYIDTLRDALPTDIEIWKAYPVADALPDAFFKNVDRHLLDAKVKDQLGGTGQRFDWSLLGENADKVMLAGGLNAENVAEALTLGCNGLDFNSGVESSPGCKDSQKLTQVFDIIRHY